MHADKATAMQGEAEQMLMSSKNKMYTVSERNVYKREAKEMRLNSQKEMDIAGNYFE